MLRPDGRRRIPTGCGSNVPGMTTFRFLPARAATLPVPAASPPAPGPVIAEIGILLACHLALALAVCLVLDLVGAR